MQPRRMGDDLRRKAVVLVDGGGAHLTATIGQQLSQRERDNAISAVPQNVANGREAAIRSRVDGSRIWVRSCRGLV